MDEFERAELRSALLRMAIEAGAQPEKAVALARTFEAYVTGTDETVDDDQAEDEDEGESLLVTEGMDLTPGAVNYGIEPGEMPVRSVRSAPRGPLESATIAPRRDHTSRLMGDPPPGRPKA